MGMLVLSRHREESIMIGEDIKIVVVAIHGDKVRLGIEAPRGVSVHRQEVYDAIKRGDPSTKEISNEIAPINSEGLLLPKLKGKTIELKGGLDPTAFEPLRKVYNGDTDAKQGN